MSSNRSLIIGMLLGDATIHRESHNLRIIHGANQREYLEYKVMILQREQREPLVVQEFDNSGYVGFRVCTKRRPIYRILRNRLYRNGIKTPAREILDQLDLPAIAIWFMDDGSTSFKNRNGKVHAVEVTLNTYLSREDNETIVMYFQETWGIRWGLNLSKGKYRLRMGTIEGRKFCALIEPYIIPSMRYKIEKLLTNKTKLFDGKLKKII